MNAMFVDIGAIIAVVIAAILLRKWWHGLVVAAIVTALWLVVDLDRHYNIAVAALNEFAWLVVAFSTVYGAKRMALWGVQSWPRAAVLVVAICAVGAGLLAAAAVYVPMVTPGPVNEIVREVADVFAPRCSPETTRVVPVPVLPVFTGDDGAREPLLTELPPAYANAPISQNPWDHFIGPYVSIRTPDAKKYRDDDPFGAEVTLTIVVGERGEVLAAVPTGGPKAFFEQAVHIARRWTFEPFLKDGKPSVVRIAAIGVSLEEPERRPGERVAFPQIEDWNSLRIRVRHRIHGFGGQDYDLTIRGDGSVVYEGRWGVALLGRHCAVIPGPALERLVDEFRHAEFFSLDDRYVAAASDMNSVEVSISFDHHVKGMYAYGTFLLTGLPDAVFALPHLTEHAVKSRRWTAGNAYTAASLLAERWDFSRWDIANTSLVAGIVTFGDAATLRDVIKAGARVSTEPVDVQVFGGPRGATSLEIAALRGEVEMVQTLLAAKAAWSKPALTSALIPLAQTADVAAIDMLLARGANVDGQDKDKKAPLMNAAQGGLPDIVDRLLRAKPAVALRDVYGRTALHWAVSWRRSDQPVLPGVDRKRVVELLAAAGADVNVRDDGGNTPLISEWDYGEDGAIALIKLGADVNAKDDVYGHSALMVCRNPKVTQLLLDAGADPYTRDSDGKTALEIARTRDGGAAVVTVLERWMAAHPAPDGRPPP